MEAPEAIHTARKIVGEPQKGDYVIAPTKHASELEAQAPSLAQVLRVSAIAVVAREYERLDSEALDAQGVFKSTASRLNLAVLVTAGLSALLWLLA